MRVCTAPKTGQHKDATTRAKCPACGPRAQDSAMSSRRAEMAAALQDIKRQHQEAQRHKDEADQRLREIEREQAVAHAFMNASLLRMICRGLTEIRWSYEISTEEWVETAMSCRCAGMEGRDVHPEDWLTTHGADADPTGDDVGPPSPVTLLDIAKRVDDFEMVHHTDRSRKNIVTVALHAETYGILDLGVDTHNTEAIEMLREQEWWLMDEDSEAVRLALTMHPNN